MDARDADVRSARGGSDDSATMPQHEGVPVVTCPFCRSHDTELISLFGGQLSTDQYYCRGCRSYFERFTRDAEDVCG